MAVGDIKVEMKILDLEETKEIMRALAMRIKALQDAGQRMVDAGTACDRREPCPPKCDHEDALNALAKVLEA